MVEHSVNQIISEYIKCITELPEEKAIQHFLYSRIGQSPFLGFKNAAWAAVKVLDKTHWVPVEPGRGARGVVQPTSYSYGAQLIENYHYEKSVLRQK